MTTKRTRKNITVVLCERLDKIIELMEEKK